MTEDHNDQNNQTTGEPVSGSEAETAPTTVPEGTGQTPVPEVTDEAIALPATTPPAPADPIAVPQQPDTPPMGVPQGSDIPQGSYAMGALAGNPMLGEPTGRTYAGPPTDPNAPMWGAPVAPSAPAVGAHHVRNGVLAGVAAFALLAGGVAIGHAAWTSGTSNLSSAPSSGSTRVPSGSGNGSGNPFGNGSPFGGAFGNSGNSGNSGSGNSGSSGGSGPSDASAIAAKVDPGLVDINTTLGYSQEQAAGTGIVLTSNGVILTNNHVINGATKISVTDVGNQKTYTAKVVGYDRSHDIAVLQLQNASGLQTAPTDTSNASVGENVVGVGNAGGTGGTPSAAGGTVTALNQSITASDEGDGTSEQLHGLIETNADIQPGDSGGALVNTSGQVIGVDTAASAGFSFQTNGQSQGTQGFAIPINTALSVARQIEAGNSSSTVHIGETAFLGVEINPQGGTGNSGSGGFGSFFGGNSGNTGSSVSGASVAGVVTNEPAQEAGIAQGDTITSLGGKTIGSANDLTDAMLTYHPGDKVSIGWTDGSGQNHTATVQLSSGPPQ